MTIRHRKKGPSSPPGWRNRLRAFGEWALGCMFLFVLLLIMMAFRTAAVYVASGFDAGTVECSRPGWWMELAVDSALDLPPIIRRGR